MDLYRVDLYMTCVSNTAHNFLKFNYSVNQRFFCVCIPDRHTEERIPLTCI